MMKLPGMIFVLLAAVLAASCATPQRQDGRAPYVATKLPTHVPDLWVFDPATSVDSTNVLIVLQGGPRDFLYFERDGRTLSRYLPGYADHHVVYLHQSQTINPAVNARGFDLTISDAQRETDITTRILKYAVEYFKAKGKRVTVVGHSYGAFVLVDYLARFESQADQYIVSAVRLDVPQALVADNLNGVTSGFAEDGATYLPFVSKDFSEYSPQERGAYHVRGLLKAAYGLPRYTKAKGLQELSNATFVSGASDQQVGTLTEAEIRFLRARGAKVMVVPGGHYDVFLRMIDAVSSGEIPFGE